MKALLSRVALTLVIALALCAFSPLPDKMTGLVVVGIALWQTIALSYKVMTPGNPAGVGRVIVDGRT